MTTDTLLFDPKITLLFKWSARIEIDDEGIDREGRLLRYEKDFARQSMNLVQQTFGQTFRRRMSSADGFSQLLINHTAEKIGLRFDHIERYLEITSDVSRGSIKFENGKLCVQNQPLAKMIIVLGLVAAGVSQYPNIRKGAEVMQQDISWAFHQVFKSGEYGETNNLKCDPSPIDRILSDDLLARIDELNSKIILP